MYRILALIIACVLLSSSLQAGKKKKKGKGKGKPNSSKVAKNMVLKGKVVLVEMKLTRLYKILTPKGAYTFARALDGKIKIHLDRNVTVYAKVKEDTVHIIEAINTSTSSKGKKS